MADAKISALPSATTPLAGTEVVPIVQSGATNKVSVNNLTAGKVVDTAGITVTDYAGATAAINVSGAGTLPARIRAVSTTTAGASLVLRDSGTTNNVTLLSSGQDLVIQTGGVQRVNVGGAGDITALTGNLVIGTSGKGIDFSATSQAGGMTSELLADYEEGTWTPTISFLGGSTGITYSLQTGTYTKVGRQVMVSFEIVLSSKGSSSGRLFINGLPFTQSGARPSGTLGYVTGTLPYSVPVNFYVDAAQIVFNPGGTSGLSDTTLSNSSAFIGSAIFFV